MRRQSSRTWIIGSVIATVGVVASLLIASPAAAATIDSTDFEDGTTGAWTQNGGAELSVEPLDRVLSVANRANDWDGVQLNTTVTAGITYTLSAKVRLADGTTGTPGVRLIAHDANYNWVGNTTMSAAGWTTVSGTYTPTADGAVQFYIGTDSLAAPYTYLVDDLSITAGSTVISAADFEDGTTGEWTQNGDPTLTVESLGQVLQVAGRANDWDGIQLNTSLTGGTTYTLSMRLKLAEGTAGTPSARFVVVDDGVYNWVGNAAVSAAAWTTITGTYTPADDGAVQIYLGTDNTGDPYTYLVDDILITTEGGGDPGEVGDPDALSTGFEDGLDGWTARDVGGSPSVDVSSAEAHAGQQSAAVTGRDSQGDGIGHDATGLLVPGVTYTLSAWVRFGAGQPVDDIWLSLAATTGASTSFSTLGQFEGMSNSGWVQVTTDFNVATADSLFLYFETDYQGGAVGNSSDFFVDDIVVMVKPTVPIQNLTPIKDTVDFPVGVAIDTREQSGSPAQLLLRHFNQVTSENYMKPEAWYDADRQFRIHPEAAAIMDFAQENDLAVYGHTLAWHSQTPAWFFQHEDGSPLTSDAADQELLRTRLHDHIFAVAEALSTEYGDFGSTTNPLVAFDVVNEVVDDSSLYADGLRRSQWYNVLGEQFIDLAFEYADEAFNEVYADAGADRPVTLFINDYNTEQSGKQARYHDLVERLLSRGVPVDGVGHQFHLALSTPASLIGDALTAFEDLPVTQAVTELDVTTGTPVTEAKLIDQGYYYRDAFRAFREHADDLFSVTVWGLTDGRSWRASAGAPLVFDDDLQAKPAYYGIVDDELPAPLRTANVFQGTVPVAVGATDDIAWKQLPLHRIEDAGAFQLRWEADHLTAYVTVNDDTAGADGVEFSVGDEVYTFGRDGTGDVPGVVASTAGGYSVVVHLPVTAALGDTLPFDARIVDDGSTVGWNATGVLGTLSLVEPLSYTEIPEAESAPTIDGTPDAVWADASSVTTDKQVSGTPGATALVRTLWSGSTLYVYAEVTDPVIDLTGSDPWTQDSVEIYVDAGNVKNGSYRYDDTQIRINAANAVSFGAGDEAFQAARLESATALTATGYVVEASISLLDAGGVGTFHGLDFQVNDASGGARTGIRNWADPTGTGYQSTARWGVGQLVEGAEPEPVPAVALSSQVVKQGGKVTVTLSGLEPGAMVSLELDPLGSGKSKNLATVKVGADGTATKQVTVQGSAKPGAYEVDAVVDGEVVASAPLVVASKAGGLVGLVETLAGLIRDLLAALFGLNGN